MERIKKEDHSELLRELVERSRFQVYCSQLLRKCAKGTCLTLMNSYDVCSFFQGVVDTSPSLRMQMSLMRVVEVDIASHRLLRVNGEEVGGIEHAQVLNLSDDGERWEGDVLNDQPYGWGVLFNADGEKVYEGFRIGETNVCYGTSFYPDIQQKEYEGDIWEGQCWGNGVQYGRNGEVVFDGIWVNNTHEYERRVTITNQNPLLHTFVEELTVDDNSCNGEEWRALDFSLMRNLRVLRLNRNSFAFVEEVKLIGMQKLEDVAIGSNCFLWHREMNGKSCYGHFYLKDCPVVEHLAIWNSSFLSYAACVIENNPSLETVNMGNEKECGLNFVRGSLQLISVFHETTMMNRLAEASILFLWLVFIP